MEPQPSGLTEWGLPIREHWGRNRDKSSQILINTLQERFNRSQAWKQDSEEGRQTAILPNFKNSQDRSQFQVISLNEDRQKAGDSACQLQTCWKAEQVKMEGAGAEGDERGDEMVFRLSALLVCKSQTVFFFFNCKKKKKKMDTDGFWERLENSQAKAPLTQAGTRFIWLLYLIRFVCLDKPSSMWSFAEMSPPMYEEYYPKILRGYMVQSMVWKLDLKCM